MFSQFFDRFAEVRKSEEREGEEVYRLQGLGASIATCFKLTFVNYRP